MAQCGMQVLRYHRNDGHDVNTRIDKYTQRGIQKQNECFRNLAVQESVKDWRLIISTYTTLVTSANDREDFP